MDKAIELFAEKLATMAEKYGPDVAAVTMQTAYLGALSRIVYGFCWLIVFGAIFWATRSLWIKSAKLNDEIDRGIARVLIGLAAFCAGVGTLIGAFDGIANVYAWASLSDPRIWLAHKILGL